MPKRKAKLKTFSVRLPLELVEAVDEVAEKEERSRNWIVKKALRSYVEKGKEKRERSA